MKWFRPTALPISTASADEGFQSARITSTYGVRVDPLDPLKQRKVFHDGLDIGNARSGDDVVAAAGGTVIAEGNLGPPWSDLKPASKTDWWGISYGGLMVVIDHGDNVISIYAHMRMTAVSAGDVVAAGQKIGEIGDTGAAKGAAHLHFGVKVMGKAIDPTALLQLQGELVDNPFIDIDESKHRDNIIRTTEAGLWAVPANKLFHPDGLVTRAQLATVMSRLLDIIEDI